MLRSLFLILCSMISIVGFCQVPAETKRALQAVSPDAIESTMNFLASDLLEGRQPGSKGFTTASQYVQTQFKTLGLQPGGEDNQYVQRVVLKKGVVDKNSSKFVLRNIDSKEWSYGNEFVFTPYMTREQSEVAAPLVFAGFGISAPELGYDDYKGIDAKGKIVVFFDQAPDIFGTNERAYFSSPNIKYQEAVKRGAIGVVTLNMSRRSSWDAIVRRNAQGAFKWVDTHGKPHNAFEQLKVIAAINPAHHEIVFSRSGKNLGDVYKSLKSGKPGPFSLNIDAELKITTRHSVVESSNVIGIIPGSDPGLKDEFVVYVAHLDHFGIGSPLKGDSIYNGAHDNASGVAIVLEIARAFRALPKAPKRSIAIAVVTGEESGLLGSDYFVSNPTVTGTIVANLTIDMPFFFHPVLDIVPYGAQHSSLSNGVSEATKMLNLKISPDPFPEQVIFIRSDHFSFVKKGIPALFIKSGFMTVPSDTVNRAKSDVAWRTTTYHTPQDDMSQAFNFGGAVTHAQVNFLIGLMTANDPIKPRWNKGDFFGEKFGKTEEMIKP
jgi:Zn-dependent M28 family amino/carboxypeptidase